MVKLKDLFEVSEPLIDERKDTDFKPISEPQINIIKNDIKDSQIEPTIIHANDNNDIIDTPIRVMMSIVIQLKMFDINSNGLTPKGKNKRELKAEIIDLVNKLSEK